MAGVVFVRGANVGGHDLFSTSNVAAPLKELDVRNVGAAGTFVVLGSASIPRVKSAFTKVLPPKIEFAVVPGAPGAQSSLVGPVRRDAGGDEGVRLGADARANVATGDPF